MERNEVVNGLRTESCAQSYCSYCRKAWGSSRLCGPSCCRLGRCLAWQQGQQRARPSDWGGGGGCAEKWAHPHTSQGLTTPRPRSVAGTGELASSWRHPPTPPPPRGQVFTTGAGSGLLSRRATKEPPAMRSHIQIRTLSRRKSAKGPDSWTAHCSPPPSFPSEMDNGQSASG